MATVIAFYYQIIQNFGCPTEFSELLLPNTLYDNVKKNNPYGYVYERENK
jgi:hypothetical protein